MRDRPRGGVYIGRSQTMMPALGSRCGKADVQEYRVFRLAGSGIIDSGWRGRFPTDDAACDHAQTIADDRPVEVWLGNRRIALVHATGRVARLG